MNLDNSNNLENKNNLTNNSNECSTLQRFIGELKEFLEKQEKKFKGNSIDTNNIRKEESFLEKAYAKHKITVSCRDEIDKGIMHILNETSKNDMSEADMYFIHNKDSEKGTYEASIYHNGKAYASAKIMENELPDNAGVDSVLRIKNGHYVLDKEVTEKLKQEIEEIIETAIEHQRERLQKARVEEHIYKVREVEKDRLWLVDETDLEENKSSIHIEEIEFPEELLESAKVGCIYQYIGGKYRKI